MKKIKIGILGTSDIAFRRFLPALMQSEEFEFAGIASRDVSRTGPFIKAFGGEAFVSYDEILNCQDIEAVYIPLPPALHFEWAKKVLNKNKHVFLEKPFTTSLRDTTELINIAKEKNLTLHENYMFQYHSQLSEIKKIIDNRVIGDIRMYHIAFGFPRRASNDFRYNKELGGGALLDCGGYTVKLASILLGKTAKITTSKLNYTAEFDVDLFGSATMENDDGITSQLSFGMDNSYKCDLEVWGSKGNLLANRAFTAPPDTRVCVNVIKGNEKEEIVFKDDQFLNSIKHFYSCIIDDRKRLNAYTDLIFQQSLVDEVLLKNNTKDGSHDKIY